MADNVVVARRDAEDAPKSPLYSQTCAFSHYNNLSAQLPIDAEGEIVSDNVQDQAAQALFNIEAIVESIGHSLTDVIRLSVFLTDIADEEAVDIVIKDFFPTYVPTKTVVGVKALPNPEAKIMIEALIDNGEGTIPNAPQTDGLIKLPNNAANAPVSCTSTQTVAFSHYNNITTQLGLDPQTGRLVVGGVVEETRQALKNVKEIMRSIDIPFDDIVKVTLFVSDINDIPAVNEVYKTFFPDSGIARAVGYVPARTVVPATLPYGAKVGVEAVCSWGDGTPPQAIEARHGLIIEASNAAAVPTCPLATQSVAFSHYNNISGQYGVDAEGNLVEGGAKAEAAQALANIKAIIESVGHVIEDTVKVNIFLADIEDLAAVNEAYLEVFPEGTPARKALAVGTLPKQEAKVLIDAIVANAEGTPPIA